jgi:hypothetical protein
VITGDVAEGVQSTSSPPHSAEESPPFIAEGHKWPSFDVFGFFVAKHLLH